jgi:hypothetical protein
MLLQDSKFDLAFASTMASETRDAVNATKHRLDDIASGLSQILERVDVLTALAMDPAGATIPHVFFLVQQSEDTHTTRPADSKMTRLKHWAEGKVSEVWHLYLLCEGCNPDGSRAPHFVAGKKPRMITVLDPRIKSAIARSAPYIKALGAVISVAALACPALAVVGSAVAGAAEAAAVAAVPALLRGAIDSSGARGLVDAACSAAGSLAGNSDEMSSLSTVVEAATSCADGTVEKQTKIRAVCDNLTQAGMKALAELLGCDGHDATKVAEEFDLTHVHGKRGHLWLCTGCKTNVASSATPASAVELLSVEAAATVERLRPPAGATPAVTAAAAAVASAPPMEAAAAVARAPPRATAAPTAAAAPAVASAPPAAIASAAPSVAAKPPPAGDSVPPHAVAFAAPPPGAAPVVVKRPPSPPLSPSVSIGGTTTESRGGGGGSGGDTPRSVTEGGPYTEKNGILLKQGGGTSLFGSKKFKVRR